LSPGRLSILDAIMVSWGEVRGWKLGRVHLDLWNPDVTTQQSRELGRSPQVEWLGQMAALFVIFWGTSTLFSVKAIPPYIPTSNVHGLQFLLTLK
jgi:hypothetical protein